MYYVITRPAFVNLNGMGKLGQSLSRIVRSAAPKSRKIQSIYPSLHGKLSLHVRGKPTDAGNRTCSFAILWISAISLTCMHHCVL